MNAKISTVDKYIRQFPDDIQAMLQKVRKTVKAAAPKSVEAIKYGMPTLVQDGKNLVHFAAFKKHIGFYPTPSGISAFKKDLAPYATSKGAIQFPLDQKIPYPLFKKITLYRIKELRDGKR